MGALLGNSAVLAFPTPPSGGGGSSGGGLYNQVMGATPTAASTGLGGTLIGTSVLQTNKSNGILLTAADYNMVSLVAAPATPYSITALMTGIVQNRGYNAGGLLFSDGNKLQMILANQSGNVYVQNWNSYNAYNGTLVESDSPAYYFEPTLWFKIRNDGTTAYFYFSRDGLEFYLLYSGALSFLSAYTYVGFGCFPGVHNDACGTTLLSWQVGSS